MFIKYNIKNYSELIETSSNAQNYSLLEFEKLPKKTKIFYESGQISN